MPSTQRASRSGVQGIEGLHHVSTGRGGLDDLGVRGIDRMLEAVHAPLQRVRRIDDDLARQVAEASGDLLDQQAGHGQHDDVRLRGGSRRGRGSCVLTRIRDEFLHLVAFRVARSVDDRVPLCGEFWAERATHVAGADDGYGVGERERAQ
jgi:hypothetical protein